MIDIFQNEKDMMHVEQSRENYATHFGPEEK